MTKYRPLNNEEKKYICKFLSILIPVARDKSHPMRDLAEIEIKETLWRWTADAVKISTGKVKKDSSKYDINLHVSTYNAIQLKKRTRKNNGLRHEHAVPRNILAKRIIEKNLNVIDMLDFLNRYCIAVIVTKEEDDILEPKREMPPNWSWKDGDPFARYDYSNLRKELKF